MANTSFLAFVPITAEVYFEVWIMRKDTKQTSVIYIRESQALAAALVEMLGKPRRKPTDADYNFVINSSVHESQLHWYLKIRPGLTTQAGFEIGSGMSINPSFREEDADFLNDSNTTKNR